MLYLHLISSPV